MCDKIEMSHRAEENLRKYKVMFSEAIWRQKKYKTIPEILDETDIPRFHFNNVTNPDKLKPSSASVPGDDDEKRGGKSYSLPLDWIQKVVWVFHDYHILVEYCRDCGCICLTPKDLEELGDIDLDDTEKIGKALKMLKAITSTVHKQESR